MNKSAITRTVMRTPIQFSGISTLKKAMSVRPLNQRQENDSSYEQGIFIPCVEVFNFNLFFFLYFSLFITHDHCKSND